MTLPAATSSPPKRFTPRYLGFESRPLRDEPPAFLCAMGSASLSSDRRDLHRRQFLPVSARAVKILAPLFLEHDDFVAAAVLDDFCLDLGAAEDRLADR